MKKCSKCGAHRPADRDHFPAAKDCKGGLAGTCKGCVNAYHRQWKAKNGARLTQQRRAAYAARYGAIQRQKEEARAIAFPVRVRAQQMRSGMRQRSMEAGVPFDGDHFTVARIMEMLSSAPACECCARPLNVGFKHDRQKHDDSPSMDRFVPALGYVQGNVALLCWRCNNLKRDATAGELATVVRWMRARALQATSQARGCVGPPVVGELVLDRTSEAQMRAMEVRPRLGTSHDGAAR